MTHPSTQPNGECADPACECHVLATKTGEGEHLELVLEAPPYPPGFSTYQSGRRDERQRVRAAIFDVLDGGCTCESGEKHPWELDDTIVNGKLVDNAITTEQRVRFVDAVIRRLQEGR